MFYFPILEIEFPLWALALVGFVAGTLGGFLGVGGGVVITPFLNLLGAPAPAIVGTSGLFIAGTTLSSTLRARALGNVEHRVAIFIALAMTPTVEAGAQFVSSLRSHYPDSADDTIRTLFIVAQGILILSVLFRDALRKRVQNPIALPPRITLRNGTRASVWTLILVGLVTGFFMGTLGLGGGGILVPALSIFAGFSMSAAAGTSSMAMLFAALYSTVTYATKGMVDFPAAAFLILGSAPGAFLGASAHTYAPSALSRFGLVGVMAASIVTLVLKSTGYDTAAFAVIMSTSGVVVAITLWYLIRGRMRKRKD